MSETKAPASQEKLVESYMKWTVDARGLNIMSAKQRASLSRRLLAHQGLQAGSSLAG